MTRQGVDDSLTLQHDPDPCSSGHPPHPNPYEKHHPDKTGWTSSTIFAALTAAIFFSGCVLLFIEAYCFAADIPPITDRVRSAFTSQPELFVVASLGFGLFFGHFFWGPREGIATPEQPEKVKVLGKEIP